MVEDERQVFKVEYRIDISHNLLAQPFFVFASDVQPVLPLPSFHNQSRDSIILQDERSTFEVEQMKLRKLFG